MSCKKKDCIAASERDGRRCELLIGKGKTEYGDVLADDEKCGTDIQILLEV